MLSSSQRIWGFETIRGTGRHRGRQGEPIDAQAHHLTWKKRPLTRCATRRPIGCCLAQRRSGDPGDVVLIWAPRGNRILRGQHVLNSGYADRRRLERCQVETLHELGCEYVIDRRANDTVLEGRAHPGRGRVAPLGKDIGPGRRHPDIVFEHPDVRRWAQASSWPTADVVTCAATVLHDRVRQPHSG